MRKPLLAALLLVALTITSAANAAAPATDPIWAPVEFLVGDWSGTGGGQGPGQGNGTTSFHWGVNHQVLVRRDFTVFPATPQHPASAHEALMVLYKDPAGLRAIYFDGEGHVIRYTLTAPAAAGSAQFLSDPGPGPRFRLTYKMTAADTLAITFEMAPPDKPDAFTPIVTGTVHRAPTR